MRRPNPLRHAAVGAAASALLLVPAANAAVEPVAPKPDALVGPLAPFAVNLTGGETNPTLTIYRSAAAFRRVAAGNGRSGDSFSLTSLPRARPDGSILLRPIEAIPPGRWLWQVRAIAPHGSAEMFPTSAPQAIRVPRVVSMTRARFQRSGASVRVRYDWRTNSPRLTHRTEVFHRGRLVRRTQSTIRYTASQRMDGRTFNASAALTNNRPPFGRIHRGVWVVRVTITDGTTVGTARAAQRYIIR